MSTPAFVVGQSVVYSRTQRGGYGFITRVPATVTRIGPRRIEVQFFMKDGSKAWRWVSPTNLEAAS